MQLLAHQCREAMYALYSLYALYSFCGEVDDIADGDALRPLKDVLLSDWRSEILHPSPLVVGCHQCHVIRKLSSK